VQIQPRPGIPEHRGRTAEPLEISVVNAGKKNEINPAPSGALPGAQPAAQPAEVTNRPQRGRSAQGRIRPNGRGVKGRGGSIRARATSDNPAGVAASRPGRASGAAQTGSTRTPRSARADAKWEKYVGWCPVQFQSTRAMVRTPPVMRPSPGPQRPPRPVVPVNVVEAGMEEDSWAKWCRKPLGNARTKENSTGAPMLHTQPVICRLWEERLAAATQAKHSIFHFFLFRFHGLAINSGGSNAVTEDFPKSFRLRVVMASAEIRRAACSITASSKSEISLRRACSSTGRFTGAISNRPRSRWSAARASFGGRA
jgi:hypothetical protein